MDEKEIFMAINEKIEATKQPISAFLNIDNKAIKGESHVEKYKDEIELSSVRWNIKQPKSATVSSAGGQSSSRSVFEGIEFVKSADLASTGLFQAAANGTVWAKIRLALTRQDGKEGQHIEYCVIEALNVVVSEVEVRNGADGVLEEHVRLNVGAIKQTYTQMLPKGGAGGNAVAQYSFALAKPTYSV